VAVEEDGRLEGEGEDFEYESKAQLLHSGITHRDAVMRRLAAEQLPALCERRPVESYVIEKFLSLLDDAEWRVRRAVVDNLTSLCEVGDQAAVKAMIRRTWSDSSWTIRLGAVEVLGKIGSGKDPQILLALLGRMEDPEAARGGRFLVREAALNTLLRLGRGGENVRVVMQRLNDEPWAERKAALQALMMASNEIPCSTDDQRHPQAPVLQGYPLLLNPIHKDSKLLEELDDDENAALLALDPENLCLKNGYKPRQKQGVILPMQTNATWKPSPSGDGDWDAKVKFEVDGNGFDESYFTENWGRHKTQTAESYMTAQLALRIKAERKARETGVLGPRSKKTKRPMSKGDIDLEEEANREREKVVLAVVPGIRDIRCTRLGEAPGSGLARTMARPKFYSDEVLPGSLNTEGRKTIHNSKRPQAATSAQAPFLPPHIAGASASKPPTVQEGVASVDDVSKHLSAAGGGAGDTAAPASSAADGVGQGDAPLLKGVDELPGMVPGRVSPKGRVSPPKGRGSPLGRGSPPGRDISPFVPDAGPGGDRIYPPGQGSPMSSVAPLMPQSDGPALSEALEGGGEVQKGDDATAALRAAMPKVGTQAAAVPAGQGVNVSRRDALLKGAMQNTFNKGATATARNRWLKAGNASRVVAHLGRRTSSNSQRGASPTDEQGAFPQSPDDLEGQPAYEGGNESPIFGRSGVTQIRPGSREGRDGREDEYAGSHLVANKRWNMSRTGTPDGGDSPLSSRAGTPSGRRLSVEGSGMASGYGSPPGSRGSPPGSRGGTPLRSSGSGSSPGERSPVMGRSPGRGLGRMNSFAVDKAMRLASSGGEGSTLSKLESRMPREGSASAMAFRTALESTSGRSGTGSGALGQLDENSVHADD